MEEEKNRDALLFWVRAIALLLGALVITAVLSAALLTPKLLQTMDHAERTLREIDAVAASAGDALASVKAVGEAAEKFRDVDFDTLNKAIADLSDVVEPLARVTNYFTR